MSRQLTLFGRVDKTQKSRSAGVYSQPSNDYERFVNYYYRRNKHQGRPREAVVKDAQTEWKVYAKDRARLSEYLEPREGELEDVIEDEDAVLMDFGLKVSEKQDPAVLDEAVELSSPRLSSTTLSPNAFDALSTGKGSSNYRTSQNNQILKSFMENFCPGKADKIISEDVLHNSSFLSCTVPAAQSFFVLK